MSTFDWDALISAANEAVDWPKGTYKMRVDGVKWGTTSNEKAKIVVRFECVAGPKAGNFLNWNLIISPESPKAMKFFFAKLSNLGLGEDFMSTKPTHDDIALKIKSRPVEYMVSVKPGEFNGRSTTDVLGVEVA